MSLHSKVTFLSLPHWECKKIRQNPFISNLFWKPWNCLSHRPTSPHWPKCFLSKLKAYKVSLEKQLEKVAKSKYAWVHLRYLFNDVIHFNRKWPDFLDWRQNLRKVAVFPGLEIRQAFFCVRFFLFFVEKVSISCTTFLRSFYEACTSTNKLAWSGPLSFIFCSIFFCREM